MKTSPHHYIKDKITAIKEFIGFIREVYRGGR
jgi:hypothetical protein